MADNSTILEKLDGLVARFEEIEDYVKADSRKKKRKHKRNKSMVSSESKSENPPCKYRRIILIHNITNKIQFFCPLVNTFVP